MQLVEIRTGRDLGALLRELYIERRRTQQEIGDALGVSRATVQNWLGDYRIERDERTPLRVLSSDGTPERIVPVAQERDGAA